MSLIETTVVMRTPGFYRGLRTRVLGLTVSLAFLTYMDRVCISVTAPSIQHDLHLSSVQMGFVFSAFTAAYALFEIPTGWWADRKGSRHVLTRIVLWWSIFTGLTGAAWNLPSLLVLRGLFGAGEAGAWPTVARSLSRWFPSKERGTAQGIFFMGAHLGGGLTPLLVAAIATRIGWRATFPTLSLLGFVWAAIWFKWYRDEPCDHSSITTVELAWIQSSKPTRAAPHSTKSLFTAAWKAPTIWSLCVMYFTQSYGFNFYVTWMLTWLAHEKGLHGTALGFFAGLPLLLSVPADLFGGLLTDFLSRRFGLRFGRCMVGGLSLAAASAFLLLGVCMQGYAAAICVALGAAFSNFLLGASWSTCSDIAGDHAAVISAAMNTSGQIGGVLSPIAFAYLTRGTNNWSGPLYLMAALYALGAMCWYFVHPERPLPTQVLRQS